MKTGNGVWAAAARRKIEREHRAAIASGFCVSSAGAKNVPAVDAAVRTARGAAKSTARGGRGPTG
jgi:hypothetical protein